MKRRTYQTLDGGTVTALRPENVAELGALQEQHDDDEKPLDADHSFGDLLDSPIEETDE